MFGHDLAQKVVARFDEIADMKQGGALFFFDESVILIILLLLRIDKIVRRRRERVLLVGLPPPCTGRLARLPLPLAVEKRLLAGRHRGLLLELTFLRRNY